MNTFRLRRPGVLLLAILALAVLPVAAVAVGPARTGYDLWWNVVPAGGDVPAMQGAYTLGATAGQPAAGLSTEGGYSLASGFWGGVAPAWMHTWLPVVLK
jgi:hypothetical protein